MGSTAEIDIDRAGRSVWVFERCGGPNPSHGLACPESKLDPVLKFDSLVTFAPLPVEGERARP
jgi:hypothetical protein